MAVLLNYNQSIDEIECCVEYADCKGVFITKQFRLSQKNCGISVFTTLTTPINGYKSIPNPGTIISSEAVAAIYFSSGTTGRSKAILIFHKALVCAAQMEVSHNQQCFEDRFLCLCPLYHMGVKIYWFGCLVVGGSIVLYDSLMLPKSILSIVEKEKILVTFFLVPQIQDILEAIDIGDIYSKQYNFSQWRLMHFGAQYIPKSLINRWHEHFPQLLYGYKLWID